MYLIKVLFEGFFLAEMEHSAYCSFEKLDVKLGTQNSYLNNILKCYFMSIKKNNVYVYENFSKKLASTNWLDSAMNPNLVFCWDHKTCEPSKIISVTLNTYNTHRRISTGASVPWAVSPT